MPFPPVCSVFSPLFTKQTSIYPLKPFLKCVISMKPLVTSQASYSDLHGNVYIIAPFPWYFKSFISLLLNDKHRNSVFILNVSSTIVKADTHMFVCVLISLYVFLDYYVRKHLARAIQRRPSDKMIN